MSSARHYVTNVFAQGIGKVLSTSSNLVGVIVVARLLGVEVFGQFAYAMAFMAVAASLADLNTTSVLAQGLARAKKSNASIFLGNFLILRGATTLMAFVLALICALFINPQLRELLLLCSLAIPFVTTRFFEPLFQVFDRPWFSTHVNLVYSLSHFSVIIAVLYWARLPLFAYIAGIVLCHIGYSIAAALLAFRLVKPKIKLDKDILRLMLAIAGPLGVGAVFYMINNKADIFMLEYLKTDYEVGIYNAAHKFLEMELFIALSVLTPAIPILSLKLAERHANAMEVCAGLLESATVCTLPIVVVTLFIANGLMEGVFGSEYSASADLLHIFAAVGVLATLSLVCSVVNLAEGKVRHAYWNTALATGVNIVLNLFWIPRYGVSGAAYATLVSHVSLLFVNYLYVVRNLGNIVRVRRWLQISVMNAILFLTLLLWKGEAGVLGTVAMLVIYFVAAAVFRLLPIHHLGLPMVSRRGAHS